jgi:hypothetical protein
MSTVSSFLLAASNTNGSDTATRQGYITALFTDAPATQWAFAQVTACVEAVILAKNEAYSRDLAFHIEKGLRANIRTRDEATGWCYKNGGRPPLGYRPEYVHCGQAYRGREAFKRIWLLDETVFAGRPMHEWVRYCLVALAAKGAPVRDLCACCEAAGIPPWRADHWPLRSWARLLRADALLTFCGYGLWNVSRGPSRTPRPPSEWEVVPAAHPAIITEAEAQAVAAARERFRALGYGPHPPRRLR